MAISENLTRMLAAANQAAAQARADRQTYRSDILEDGDGFGLYSVEERSALMADRYQPRYLDGIQQRVARRSVRAASADG